MMNKNYMRRVAVALTACLIGGQAVAACQQSDIADEWQAYLQTYQRGVNPSDLHATSTLSQMASWTSMGSRSAVIIGVETDRYGVFPAVWNDSLRLLGMYCAGWDQDHNPTHDLEPQQGHNCWCGGLPRWKVPRGNFVFTAVQP
ncbi:hypothetical protein [Geminicoccus flavidas]|uniref:hypothetical protein n=1 Tax=Geminicoccus flavidas TaxID=2506407 RepID=UPI001357C955|nr:hypothetical protein [Geminicoccus flavidas]